MEYLLTGRDQHKLISNIPVHTMLEDIAKELVFFDPFDVETLKMLISAMAQRYRKTPQNHELI